MSKDYNRVKTFDLPKSQLTLGKSAETEYWKLFKEPVTYQHYSAITHIDFCKSEPNHFCAVTASTRIHVYDPQTNSVCKVFSRFKDVAYSGVFKSDGRLMAAGGAHPDVQIFETASRSILRTFRAHTLPVHVVRFSDNSGQLYSASDDKTIKLWDIASEKHISSFSGHTDYIRTGCTTNISPDIFITGSYDHTIRVWDSRSDSPCVRIFEDPLNVPIENVLAFPNGTYIASAAGNQLKVWDILSGKLVHASSNHQKTITALAFDTIRGRIITGSLDQHAKIYDSTDFTVRHSVKYASPILSIGISPNESHLVCGMVDGSLNIKKRLITKEEKLAHEEGKLMSSTGAFRFFIKPPEVPSMMPEYNNQHEKPKKFIITPQTTIVVAAPKKRRRLPQHDKLLKSFFYKEAFEAAMKTKQVGVILAVMEELDRQRVLVRVLESRSEEEIRRVINFFKHYITNPRYCATLIPIAAVILDMQLDETTASPNLFQMWKKLSKIIHQQVALQKELLALQGALGVIMTSIIQK